MGTPENQMGADPAAMDPATPPAEAGEGTPPAEGTDEGSMQTLIEFLRNLFLDPAARQDYLADPGATINQVGLAGVSGADVHQAMGTVADTLPPEYAGRISPYINQGYGGGGGGATQTAIQEINTVINYTYVDDRDVIISDNDVNVDIDTGAPPAPAEPEVPPMEEPEPPGEAPPEEEPAGEVPVVEDGGVITAQPPGELGDYIPKEYEPAGNLPEDADMLPPPPEEGAEPPGGPPLTPPPEGP